MASVLPEHWAPVMPPMGMIMVTMAAAMMIPMMAMVMTVTVAMVTAMMVPVWWCGGAMATEAMAKDRLWAILRCSDVSVETTATEMKCPG